MLNYLLFFKIRKNHGTIMKQIMNTNNGYIYIRYHTSYESLCKLGKTGNLIEMDVVYATGEPIRGTFESVLEQKIYT